MKNSLDIHFALRNPVYVLLMRSKEIYTQVEEMYIANESHYKPILENLRFEDSFFHGLQATDKWGVLLLHAVTKEMEEENEKTYLTFIDSLIKKSFKRIYDFTHQNGFNIELFSRFIENREPNADNLTMDMYNFLHLYIAKDLPPFELKITPLAKVMLENLRLMNNPPQVKRDLLDSEIEGAAIEYYQEITGKKWRNQEAKSLRNIIVDIETMVHKNHPLVAKQVMATGNTRLAYKYKPLSYLRHGLSVMNLLDYDNTYFFYDLKISREEWAMLYLSFFMGSDKGFTDEDKDMAMMYALIEFSFHKAYRRLEDAYWESHLSHDIKPLQDALAKVKEAEKQLELDQEIFKKEQLLINKEREESKEAYESEIARLQKQLEQLTNEKNQLEEQVELMPSLQAAVFYKEEEIHPVYEEEVEAVEAVTQIFKDKKVVLVGGHDKFRRKLAESFEGLYTISPDEKHIGSKQVEQADIVLFETSYNNHVQFERFKPFLSSKQVVFINHGSSLHIIAERILKQFK